MAKLTPALESRLGTAAPGEEVDVILEMSGDLPPAPGGKASSEYVDSMRQAFQENTTPITRLIKEIGGEVVAQNWLNRAMKVRIPAGRVPDLLDASEINVIDVPRRLTRA